MPAALAKRFAAWDFTTTQNYKPGWEYTGSPGAQASYKSKKDELARTLTEQANLMQDAEYAGLLKSVNEFVKQPMAQMIKGAETTPAAQAQFRRAHARLVEIETAKSVRGYSTQFTPDMILSKNSALAPASTPRPKATSPWPVLAVQGVMGSEADRVCTINGQALVVGGEIQGVQIVEIKSGAVVVALPRRATHLARRRSSVTGALVLDDFGFSARFIAYRAHRQRRQISFARVTRTGRGVGWRP